MEIAHMGQSISKIDDILWSRSSSANVFVVLVDTIRLEQLSRIGGLDIDDHAICFAAEVVASARVTTVVSALMTGLVRCTTDDTCVPNLHDPYACHRPGYSKVQI